MNNNENITAHQYCILKVDTKLFSSKIEFELDLGKETINAGLYESAVMQKTESVTKFTNLIDALNYLSTLGWEIVNVHYREMSGTTYNNPQYLLKRKV
ncbi:hypothetical protein [Mucilaginibacter terrae]|uniref:DUF4177 domain-containing protein n=1 Tax=Mucilaginibacter terrae TaxID=1955052 RepID=A0ABU3GP51_9SPHI|nr:hypothetical protein [Mucilaginibacter terrae]MDT3401559.1 hypothetical protein [Mucilaginibacter terrae]